MMKKLVKMVAYLPIQGRSSLDRPRRSRSSLQQRAKEVIKNTVLHLSTKVEYSKPLKAVLSSEADEQQYAYSHVVHRGGANECGPAWTWCSPPF